MINSQTRFTRDRPILPGRAALLIIDVQNATCGPKQKAEKPKFYLAATLRVIPNISRLLAAFRSGRLEVFLRYRRFQRRSAPRATAPFRQIPTAPRCTTWIWYICWLTVQAFQRQIRALRLAEIE